jgi:autotransporter-associated beta strand protein
MNRKKMLALSGILTVAWPMAHSGGQTVLSGLLQQGANPQTGQSDASPVWNTVGYETSFARIYLTQPNAGYTAPFLNSGNGADAGISYSLTPGTYQFYFFTVSFFTSGAEPENNPGTYGLNLFFDGDSTYPGIAAYSPENIASAVQVQAGQLTLSLNGNENNEVPTSGSLTYIADGLITTLTDYGFGTPGTFGGSPLDRVGNLNSEPDGYPDAVGFFDLTVTTEPVWTGGGSDGNWTTAANWGGTAPSPNDPLIFSGNTQLANENDFAAGTQFNGITFSAGAGAFTLSGNAINLGGDIVNNSTNLQTINVNLALQQNTNLNAASGDLAIGGNISGAFGITLPGPGTVTLSGSNSYTGGTTVNTGKLLVAAANALPSAGELTVGSAGAVQLESNIGTVRIQSLMIDSDGTLDLNSTVIINYGSSEDPISSVIQYIRGGYNAGFWNGTGISSSSVASLNSTQSRLLYAIGYADGADGLVDGLSSGQIEIMPTLAGDAKLESNVVFGDFQLLSEYFNQPGSWDEGNFTYGPTINFGDFQLLSQNFGANASALTAGELASLNGFASGFGDRLVANPNGIGFSLVSVPEPAATGLIALPAFGVLRRRRRTN